MSNRRPMLDGRELSRAELEHIRLQLDAFDFIGELSNELRALIGQQWPELLTKIKSAEQN